MEGALAWYTVLPFVALLLSIAVLPLIPGTSHWWEHNRNKLIVALALGIPVAAYMLVVEAADGVVHALVEYAQFIVLLLALFTISGGIHLAGDLRARPLTNTGFLAFGAVIASFIGTTGAAMLLIRPLLRTNAERELKTHTVVFFIFTVANSGGLLTPLGDPPLFLGMLRGVPFLWTLQLLPEWAFVNGLLLVSYFALDKYLHAQEPPAALAFDESNVQPLKVLGKRNLLFLLGVVLCVALVPSVDTHAIATGHALWYQWVPWRELGMLTSMALSLVTGDDEVRYTANQFTWGPILEVAAIFIGIFLTMIPALRVLGQIAPTLPLNEVTFFLFSGGLSAVLDNAPTYATFFEMAHTLGEEASGVTLVAGVPEPYLVAISLGSVFCGAMTYIGNGPNFMVKAVAEEAQVAMPSFGGYIVWAARYLAPVLTAMVCIFIADGWWAKALGLAITAVLLTLAVINIRRGGQRAESADASAAAGSA
ncbi:MAG TPA: sodium:proton antiporter [Micropruina sp.]|nr:sodium:proton antiporter [Micropruina sp.]